MKKKIMLVMLFLLITLILRISYNYAVNIIIEKGDIDKNSEINESDIYEIKSKIVELKEFSNEDVSLMDINDDGKITVTDLSLLRAKINQETNPESITLNKTDEILYLNGTKKVQLVATIFPTEANVNRKINWKSSNEEIAIVDDTGLVEAISEGETIITATTENGKEANCKITVTTQAEEIVPERITLNKTEAELDLNGTKTLQLEATIIPINANTYKNITWTSLNETIAKVSDTGLVTAISTGTTEITATTENKKVAICKIKVIQSEEKIIPEAITLNETEATLDLNGTKSIQLEATIVPTNANIYNKITWSSENREIAEVSTSGLVTAISVGNTRIIASTENGKIAVCNIVVTRTNKEISPETITLNKTAETLDLNGTKSIQLEATITPQDANINTEVMWQSANSDIATVTTTGLVTAVNIGTTEITATTTNGIKAKCTIIVTKSEEEILPESITLNKTEATLDLNGIKNLQLEATILPTNANSKITKTYKSSNESVATVTTTGLVTAMSEGTTVITVSTENEKTATCKITVISTNTENIINLYISPNGNDNNDGLSETTAKKTIDSAKNLARNYSQTKDVVVNLAGGDFNITEPIVFTNNDSAGEGHTVTYKGTGETVINGGVTVSNWNQVSENCWSTSVNDISAISGFYVNGEEKKIASKSWYNLSGDQLGQFAIFDSTNGYITIAANELSGVDFSNDTNIKIIICVEWMQYSFVIDSVRNDSNGNYIFVLDNNSKLLLQSQIGQYASPDGQNKPVIEFRIENAYGLMDEEGEYYYNGSNLYYYSSENLSEKDCVIAKSEGLIKIEGTDSKLVTNLNFENIKFKYSRSTKYDKVAFYTSQAEEIYVIQNSNLTTISKMDGQVFIDHARNISFNGCEFTSLNATAMEIYQYAYNINLTGNKFKDIGGAAIRVGYATLQGNTNPLPSDISSVTDVSSSIVPLPAGITIYNNYIENVGTTYYAGIGIVIYYANDVRISHNTVYKVSYSGISLGWGWSNSEGSSVPTSHGDISLEYNVVKDTNRKLIDGAPIYTLGCFYKSNGKDYGCSIEHNYIDTSGDPNGYHGGVYLDEGSEFVYVADNLIVNIGNYINARSITNYESHRIKNSTIEENYTDVTTGIDSAKDLVGTNVIISNNHTGINVESDAEAQRILANAGFKE